MFGTQVMGMDGKPVQLHPLAAARAEYIQQQLIAQHGEMLNSLGYQVDITTLTQLLAQVIEQKFYTIPFADYVPVNVGEGAWSVELLTYRSFQIGADFEKGIVNTATENSRIAEVSAGIDAVRTPVVNWATQINWTIMDIAMAAKAGNWDLITAKETARKTNWDQGLQKIAFLGSDTRPNVKGLLTLANVNANTSLITKKISLMTDTEFQTLVANIIGAYRSNAQYTAYPDRFVIPEDDYNGLGSATSETFPMITKLQYLQQTFATLTMNPNFKIMPLAYANQAQNADVVGLNKNRYTLFRASPDTVRMNIPVDYTNTMQNSLNNFQFQSVAYGQFTGVQAYRELEVLYFDWAA